MQVKNKIIFGQFFTKEKLWLKPQILNFIKYSKCDIAYDPFAGEGNLLDIAKDLGFNKVVGLDIDEKLGWIKNDSLKNIPHISDKTLIITNPPYLSNYSASRKGIKKNVQKYFDNSVYDDLYLIALDKMLNAQKFVVAILPETFINSNFRQKNYLTSITILEENPFQDTDTPIVVACFDGEFKPFSSIKIFKNDEYINDLDKIEMLRLNPKKNLKMTFNDKNGWLAVRCIDSTNPKNKIKFGFLNEINYNWDKGIKNSSRLFTIVNLDIKENQKEKLISTCNKLLNDYRQISCDVVLSPFKGNMKNGQRRRRLDFKTCRAIIELANELINKGESENGK